MAMKTSLLCDIDHIHAIIRQTFGDKTEIEDIEIKKSLRDYQVLIIQLRAPKLKIIFKIAGSTSERASQFDRTAMIIRRVHQETKIPMAEMIGYDVSLNKYPFKYSIQSFIPGIEWAKLKINLDQEQKEMAYQQIGEAIARIHGIKFDLFGDIDHAGSVQGSHHFFSELRTRTTRNVTNHLHHDLIDRLFEKYSGLFEDQTDPCLCHEDFHKYNILFNKKQGEWQLATILDFEKCWAGKHEIDLARLELWNETNCSRFWEAYLSRIEVDPGYPARRPIFQLIWCLEYDQRSPEFLRETQNLCLQLGLPFREETFGE
jgi:aminoglycoside phosphotransferase (APT) family kinase protein